MAATPTLRPGLSGDGLSFETVDALIAYGVSQGYSEEGLRAGDTERIREQIISRLRGSDLLRQYIRHLDAGRAGQPNANRLAWHAAGERLYAALLLATVGYDISQLDGGADESLVLCDGHGRLLPDHVAIGCSMMVLAAHVYLWSFAIEELADAAPLPRHVIGRDLLPFPTMFWSQEGSRKHPDGENNWHFLMHTPHGIRLVGDALSPVQSRLLMADIAYGATYPDDFDEHERAGVGAILARLAFLRSPYIAPEGERLPRPMRRRALKGGLPEPMADPLIHVVRLRHDAAAAVKQQQEDEAGSSPRRSHWWVSGHLRAQWFPSKQAHEVIWIRPYLKGDLSKPLREKVYQVVR